MIIDINAYLGKLPNRRAIAPSAEELIKLMDEAGIDIACVSSTKSLYYDFREGDRELLNKLSSFKDRLVGFACVNPMYEEARELLMEEVEDYGVKGLKLHPQHHGYSLENKFIQWIFEEAARFRVPVLIPIRVQAASESPSYLAPVKVEKVEAVAERFPDLKLLVGGVTYWELFEVTSAMRRHENMFIELSFFDTYKGIEALVRKLGNSRIFFGSGMPINQPEVIKALVEEAEISEDDKRMILAKNARRVLNIA